MRQFLSTEEAAKFLGLGSSTLEKYRTSGMGPKFCKLGPKRVVYRVDDLEAWATSNRGASTAKTGSGRAA